MMHLLIAMACAAGAGGPQRFDASKIENVEGTIEKVVTRGGMGVHVLLKTATETIDVHLGPAWFIDNQEAKLKAGDTVNVRGSRTVVAGEAAIVAIDVKRGGETLRLRDEDGTPVWAAWRDGRGCPRRGT